MVGRRAPTGVCSRALGGWKAALLTTLPTTHVAGATVVEVWWYNVVQRRNHHRLPGAWTRLLDQPLPKMTKNFEKQKKSFKEMKCRPELLNQLMVVKRKEKFGWQRFS